MGTNPSEARAKALREVADSVSKLKVDSGSESAKSKIIERLKALADQAMKAASAAPTPVEQNAAVRQEE